MADPKRQSSGGKVPVATPNIGPTGMILLEPALSGCIGARIRITTSPPASITLEGTLFTVDSITNLIALNTSPPPPTPLSPTTSSTLTQPGDYHIIPITRINNLQILSLPPAAVVSAITSSDPPSFATANPSIHSVDLRALRARENAAIARLHEKEQRRGKGVSREAQDIFDALGRTMPTRWEGSSIVVTDNVIIKPPYNAEDCRSLGKEGEGSQALGRVVKVLEMERQKIGLRNSASKMNVVAAPRVAIPTTPVAAGGLRKGG